jgi:hypothetical protein
VVGGGGDRRRCGGGQRRIRRERSIIHLQPESPVLYREPRARPTFLPSKVGKPTLSDPESSLLIESPGASPTREPSVDLAPLLAPRTPHRKSKRVLPCLST